MNKRIDDLIAQATYVSESDDPDYRYESFDKKKFAELIVLECANVCLAQRDPANLNYKPSERFAEAVKQHFYSTR
jgi:hypothetical protein